MRKVIMMTSLYMSHLYLSFHQTWILVWNLFLDQTQWATNAVGTFLFFIFLKNPVHLVNNIKPFTLFGNSQCSVMMIPVWSSSGRAGGWKCHEIKQKCCPDHKLLPTVLVMTTWVWCNTPKIDRSIYLSIHLSWQRRKKTWTLKNEFMKEIRFFFIKE